MADAIVLEPAATIDGSEDKVSLDEQSATYISSDLKNLDVALTIAAHHTDERELDPQEACRLRRKIDWHIIPLLCAIYTVQFIDKNTLSSSSILGFIQDNHLTQDDYNTLNSAFYIGYLVFALPQTLAMQYFPVGKWLTFNILLWCIFLGLQPLCHSFSSFFALRFLLGSSESCMTTGLMIVISMYYTRTEIGERIGWTYQCNGVASMIGGFIAFAVYHASPNAHPNQWQWFMIVTSLVTLCIFVCFFFYFPDNPTSAYFLTEDEKARVIQRVQANQNGIETKKWKKYQFIEALTDIKTWLFFLYTAFGVLGSGGIGVEFSLLVKSFGFTTLQTTLINIPSGFCQILGITSATICLHYFPNSRTAIGLIFWVPAIACAIVQIAVPFSNKTAHLGGLFLEYFGGSPSFIMVLSWITSATSGHTKKVTTKGIVFIGYALGQMLSPQFWKDKYKPRNIVPWSIVLCVFTADFILTLVIYHILSSENKRRDALRAEAEAKGLSLLPFEDHAYVDTTDKDGNVIRAKVDKFLLDLTDRENLAFRYVL